jgi:hypothetical protein
MKAKLLTAVFLMIGINSYEQIIYTDLIPNIFLDASVQPMAYLDIDQNGNNDFCFSMNYEYYEDSISGESWSEFTTWINGIGSFRELAIDNSGNPNYQCIETELIIGDTINSEGFIWGTGSYLWNIWDGIPFCVQPPNMNFIGVRIKTNGSYKYGWIRINSEYTYTIIHDMALNLQPNEPILAGQTSLTSISEVNFEKIEVYPNPATDELNIRQPENNLQECKLFIIALTGEIMKTIDINPVQLNTINISDLPMGMYLLQFICQQKSYYEKLIVY